MLELIGYSVLIFQNSHVSENQHAAEKTTRMLASSQELSQALVPALGFPDRGVKIPHFSHAVTWMGSIVMVYLQTNIF